MATQEPARRLLIRWTTLKERTAIIVFFIIAALIEYTAVLYAINLGVKDATAMQWNTQFVTITISPLFHLVPLAVIITLLFSWTYLTRHIAIRPYEERKTKSRVSTKRTKESDLKGFMERIKSGLLRVKGISYLWQRIHFARATIKSAFTVLLAFGTFILIISLVAFPNLIPQTMANLYQNNPGLLSSVKGTADTLAPVGGIFSGINSALLAAAPSFQGLVSGLGNMFRPLTSLDNAGKYLFFQNAAAWIAAFMVLFYGELRRSYRYQKRS